MKMLQNPKVVQAIGRHSQNLDKAATPAHSHTCPSPPVLKLSRRELAISSTKSSLLLLLVSHTFHLSKAIAQENLDGFAEQEESPSTENTTATTSESAEQETPTNGDAVVETVVQKTENAPIEKIPASKRAFLDVSINGEPIGRIVIELNGESAPAGVARFSALVSGSAGISYRRKEFIKITPKYVQHSGVRSYGVDAELAKKTGSSLETGELVAELERENENSSGTKNVAGSVGIIVRDPTKPPPKMKLVARNGKLEIDEEEIGKDPNGTEFVIAMKDSPELDESTLVIGKVLEGMEVVQRIGQVKTVNENTSSPYFRVAKLIGDKRAVVAERGFNRPYAKVLVTNCGVM